MHTISEHNSECNNSVYKKWEGKITLLKLFSISLLRERDNMIFQFRKILVAMHEVKSEIKSKLKANLSR